MKKKIYFLGKYQKYFIWCWKYQKFLYCYALLNLLIFSPHPVEYISYSPKKVNILYFFFVKVVEKYGGLSIDLKTNMAAEMAPTEK